MFNLASDPGETTDLSAARPQLLTEMVADYKVYAERVGVLAMPEDYDSAAQNARNNIGKLLANHPWLYAAMACATVLIGLGMWGLFRVLRRWFRQAAT